MRGGENSAATVQSPGQPWVTAFDPGAGAPGGNIVMDDAVGGVWYILNGDANGNRPRMAPSSSVSSPPMVK